MTAWQRLLAASSLVLGTAWDLITHPKAGGAGVIVNNGATAFVKDSPTTIVLAYAPIAVALPQPNITVAVSDSAISASVAPGITVQISTQPITI
jgi:hypothetical protein